MESDASDALTSDEIYVLKQGNILGPFTRERLRTALAGRELNPEDFAQTGSIPIWQPLARIIGDTEVELRGAIAPDWKSLLQWAWLRLRYDIDERSEIAGSVCLGIGLLVLALSHWTFLFWLPWTGAALLAAVALLQRRRYVVGILLLIGVIILPLGVFMWHAKLRPAGALPFQSSTVASPDESLPSEPETTDTIAEPEPPPATPLESPESKPPEPAPTIPVAPRGAQVPAMPPAPVLRAPVAGTEPSPVAPPAPPAAAIPAADDPADYFNPKAGDEWAMDAAITLPNGKELNATARRKIEGSVEKDGKTYFRARTWMEGLPSRSETTRLFRKEARGTYSVSEMAKDLKEQAEMLFPVKVGNTWQIEDQGKVSTVTVVGIENITIGDKTYKNCIHVRTTSAGGRREDYWEAAKLGTIKSEAVIPNGPKFALTLREFRPGK